MRTFTHYFTLCCLLAAFILTTGCDDASEIDRVQFIGSYSVEEDCSGSFDAYTMSIASEPSDEDQIIITNLFDLGAVLEATVSGNTLTIPSQVHNGYTYSGSGSISGDVLSINFNVSFWGDCVAIATK